MPRRHVQMHMIVMTDKGYILVDKDGNETPLKEEKKPRRRLTPRRKNDILR